MKKTNRLLQYLLYLFLIAIGAVIGIAIRHYSNIPLEETLNLVDVATLVVTVFLAVYIPEVLDRKLQKQRDKKMLLENRITEFQTLQRKINSLVQDGGGMSEKNYQTVENQLEVSMSKFETIATLIRFAKFEEPFEKEIAHIEALCKEHKRLLYIKEEEGTKYFYPDPVQHKEQALFNELDKASSMLLFKISDTE